MKVAQIKDLAQLADGTTIGEMRLSIKKVWPARTGQGKFGEWRVQNCEVSDATGEAKASFWIKDEMKDLEGQMITIRSRAGKKGLEGLSVKYSEHAATNELRITDKAAIIDDVNEATATLRDAGARPSALRSAPATNPVEAKKALFQMAQLMVEAIKAAQWAGTQVELPAEELLKIACSLYISGERVGLAKAFPTSDKPKQEEVKPAAVEEEDSDEDIGF